MFGNLTLNDGDIYILRKVRAPHKHPEGCGQSARFGQQLGIALRNPTALWIATLSSIAHESRI